MAENLISVHRGGRCRRPAVVETGLQKLVDGGLMRPDGDRRHLAESGHRIGKEEAFGIGDDDVVGELVLRMGGTGLPRRM